MIENHTMGSLLLALFCVLALGTTQQEVLDKIAEEIITVLGTDCKAPSIVSGDNSFENGQNEGCGTAFSIETDTENNIVALFAQPRGAIDPHT